MILLDTNVLICAFDERSPHSEWARQTIAAAVAGEGAAVNVVSLAELCVGDADPSSVADRVRRWGVAILDIPAAAAEPCARAYRDYRERRAASTTSDAPLVPLPDFFIGAHAEIMGWSLATADQGRFSTYFASVTLEMPA